MNANSPGVQSQPKVSPLAQHSTNGHNTVPQTPQTPSSTGVPPPPPPPPAPSMGSLAMGMPFQVLPPGGLPVKNNKQLSPPQNNGNINRKSPSSFDPPPMGCRPEIKIPSNPMSLLKQTPRPQPKDDFWVQEYVQEKRESSDPKEEEQTRVMSPPVSYQQQQMPLYQPSPVSSPQMKIQSPQSPMKFVSPPQPPPRSPSPLEQHIRNIKLEEAKQNPPTPQFQPQVNRVSPPKTTHMATASITPIRTVTTEAYQPQQQFNYANNQQQQQQSSGGKIILSTMPSRLNTQAQQHVTRDFLKNIFDFK
jgi:hypothetical protein